MARGLDINRLRAAQALQERVRLNNTTPLAELALLFTVEEVAAINAHQWLTFDIEQGRVPAQPDPKAPPRPSSLSKTPLPAAFTAARPNDAHYLTQNTSAYDDPLEDAISDDPIVQAYVPQTRSSDPDANLLAMDVLRSRRTIIALAGYVGLSALRPVVELPVPVQTAGQIPSAAA